MARQTTTQPVSNRIAKMIRKVGDPVILRRNGEDIGVFPNELATAISFANLAGKPLRIRRSTVRTLAQLLPK